MKKILCILLALAMITALSACGGTAAQPAQQQTAAPAEPAQPASEAPAEPGAPEAPAEEDYGTIPPQISFGTNPSGQAAYTMGAGIADVINKANIGTTATSEETNGFPVNVNLLMNGDIEFAFVNNMIAEQAYAGTGSYSGIEPGQVMSVLTLSPTEMHVIVPAGSDVKSVYDFAGKRVGLGQPGGIALEVANLMVEACGYGENDFEHVEVNLATQCDYLKDGQIDVLVWIGSAPLAAVSGLIAEKEVEFLDIPDEVIAKMQESCAAIGKQTIAAGTYAGLDRDVATFGLRMTIVTRADVSNECVYQVTKLIMENVEELGQVHAAMGKISPDNCTVGLTAATPLHPGAARYYTEIGMDVSELLP